MTAMIHVEHRSHRPQPLPLKKAQSCFSLDELGHNQHNIMKWSCVAPQHWHNGMETFGRLDSVPASTARPRLSNLGEKKDEKFIR